MTTETSKWRQHMAGVVLAASGLLAGSGAHAIGADHGDWVAPPPGKTLFVLYGQDSQYSKAYAEGNVVLDDAKLHADVGILRVTKPFSWGDVIVHPQVLVPFGRLKASGNLSGLGSTSGVGDIILVNGVFLVHDWEARKHFAIVPYLFLPTGSYDHNRGLNFGEHRWKAALQAGGQYPISDRLTHEVTADVTFFGKNTDAGPSGTSLTQKPLGELRTYLTYAVNPANYTTVAAGLGHVWGGQTTLGGAAQSDRKSTTTMYLQTQFAVSAAKSDFLLLSYEHDLQVSNGLKLDNQLRARYLKIF